MGFFDLETVIYAGTSLWLQMILIFVLTVVVIFSTKIFDWIDRAVAVELGWWFDHQYERKATAPMTVITDEFVYPDPSIPINWSQGKITRLSAIEQWLTVYPLDYSWFYDYEINPNELKAALSRLLSKLPIIGGTFCKIDDQTLGINHSEPRIQFIYAQSNVQPSIDYHDLNKPNWFMKFTNGGNTKFPYPKDKPVFKVTVIHFPNLNDPQKKKTLIAIGCVHALTDGDGFFMLMRCWASEMRKEQYEIPIFDRSPLLLHSKELHSFKPRSIILGKEFVGTIRRTSFIANAVWPSRRWVVRDWKFTKKDILNLKKYALSGSHGELLSKMRISTNDVLTALYWKIRATLNIDYPYEEPTVCTLAINTRSWMDRIPKKFLGNAIAFLVLAKTRKELIQTDFSGVVYIVRSAVSCLRKEEFELDLHLYTHLSHEGVENLYRYHGRWVNGDLNFSQFKGKGRYLYDRDMMISNLVKLPSMTCDFHQNQHPYHVRFNFNADLSPLGYVFKHQRDGEIIEFYTAIPSEHMKFYDEYDVTKIVNWDEINAKYAKETRRWIRNYPPPRLPYIDFHALFQNQSYRNFIRW